MSYRQSALKFAADTKQLEQYLSRLTAKPVSITITDNAVSMLSVRIKKDAVVVRMHRMFLAAPEAVFKDIAAFVARKNVKTPHLKSYINDNRHTLATPRPAKHTVRADGTHWHLQEIFDALNGAYFNSKLVCSITWGRRSTRPTVKKRTLGSYSAASGMIRINPILDRKEVPRYYIEYVVYHEMLHAALGVAYKNGRRVVHSRQFKQREKCFRYYEQAVRWERNLFAAGGA